MKLHQTILICIALYATAFAETSTQLFNPAAKEYIYGNTPVASNLVTQALSKFPDDEKLQKLKKLIDEQQQQKKNQQKQKNQDQQKQDQQNQDQKKNQDKQKDQQQNQQDQKKQQKDQQKQSDQNKEQPKPDQQQQPAQPKQAGEMSPEEAQQLLDAMKQNEQDQRANLTPFLGGPVRVEKDW